MLSDPKEVSRVSQNLSLRLSPERKYSPKNLYSDKTSNPLSKSSLSKYCCYRCCCCCCYNPCCCCNPCCCYDPCCCYNPCCYDPCKDPCLNFDYNSPDSLRKIDSLNNIGNPSLGIGSTRDQTRPGPSQNGNRPYQAGGGPYQPGSDSYQPGRQPYQPGSDSYQPGRQPYQPGSDSYQPGRQPSQPGRQPYQPSQEPQGENTNNNYEQNQFNDFLKKLMDVESKIENAKTNLALNPDFNCEDVFRLFETNDKGYLTEEDIKNGLNLIGLNPSDQDVKLLMKRFDLQKNGNINYADFFDIIVPFEKDYRTRVENRMPNSTGPTKSPDVFNNQTLNGLRDLFNLIINSENEINNMRKSFGTLRLNLRDIFGLLDNQGCGYFTDEQLLDYLQNNGILTNNKDADLLFIRLDKNRNGRIDYPEVEEEIQTLY